MLSHSAERMWLPLAHPSLCFLSPSSDVLCPSVRVEGDRFKHTNGGSKEITGEKAQHLPACSAALFAPLDAGLASLICSPKSSGRAWVVQVAAPINEQQSHFRLGVGGAPVGGSK